MTDESDPLQEALQEAQREIHDLKGHFEDLEKLLRGLAAEWRAKSRYADLGDSEAAYESCAEDLEELLDPDPSDEG